MHCFKWARNCLQRYLGYPYVSRDWVVFVCLSTSIVSDETKAKAWDNNKWNQGSDQQFRNLDFLRGFLLSQENYNYDNDVNNSINDN